MALSDRFQTSLLALAGLVLATPAGAQSLAQSLTSAYANNPQLNIARSTGRAADEGVAIALSGYRPSLNGSVTTGITDQRVTAYPTGAKSGRTFEPTVLSLTLVQPLYTGGRVTNSVNQSEASVLAQREIIRNTEQSIFLQAATAFGDVIRDGALVSLSESNIKFLAEQVRAAKDRFNVGEGTRTDVAQAEASYEAAIAQMNANKAQLAFSRATFRQVTGLDAKNLSGSLPLDRLMPKTAEAGVSFAQSEHPAIKASVHNVDVAAFNVKILEGALLPQLNLQGGVSYGSQPSANAERQTQANIGLNLTVPLYQGGGEYARVRQAKEQLGTARIQVDLNRDQVRAQVISSWGQLQAARASVEAAKAQTEASDLALSGVIEEQRVGQRTTLDVLNAQTAVVNARSALATATRNVLVASFSLVAATGKLDADNLGLKVARYAPEEHYNAVRDKWVGLRTPDGR